MKHFPHHSCPQTPVSLYISSSTWFHNARSDLPDPLLPSVFIVHRSWEVFQATFRIGTELWYIGSSWSSNLSSSMWRGPLEYVTYEFVLTSPAASHISGSSNLGSFRDGKSVAEQLLFCRVFSIGLVQFCSRYYCVIAVKFFFSKRLCGASK